MSFFLVLNNLHFSLEIIGAIIFLAATWLAYDAFLLRRDFIIASKGLGFLFLAARLVLHASQLAGDIWLYAEYIVSFLGMGFLIWNLLLEAPGKRPEFRAIILLPGLSLFVLPLNTLQTLGLAVIFLLSFHQYRGEQKYAIRPLAFGFLLLAIGGALSIIPDSESLGFIWTVKHLFELAGFLSIGLWLWSYLELRIREEMLIVFISLGLFMGVLVSLTFSSILLGGVESSVKENLVSSTKVLELAINGLREEALAKIRLLKDDEKLILAAREKDFVRLDEAARSLLAKENLGFLTVTDAEGEVMVRAHAPSKKEDNLRGEEAVRQALAGKSFVTIESSAVEKFSIRASSPLMSKGRIIGAVVGGFPLDNAFADNMKRVTGLEVSVFDRDYRVATSARNKEGEILIVGTRITDSVVRDKVLLRGEPVTARTEVLSRPFLASYLPLRNAQKEVAGIIGAEKSQQEIFKTAQTTNRLTLAVVIILMVILMTPIYLITKRLSEEAV